MLGCFLLERVDAVTLVASAQGKTSRITGRLIIICKVEVISQHRLSCTWTDPLHLDRSHGSDCRASGPCPITADPGKPLSFALLHPGEEGVAEAQTLKVGKCLLQGSIFQFSLLSLNRIIHLEFSSALSDSFNIYNGSG